MERATLARRVYDQLRQRLRSGDLRPGARLVNRTLAAELGTSTIPVREAIGRLSSEGLLELTPGAGAFVPDPGPDELAELYDVREALEVLAAAAATRFAGEHLVTELRVVCGGFRDVARAIPRGRHATPAQFARWLEAEEQFHTRLVMASRNRWLVKAVNEFRVIAQVFASHRATPQLLTRPLADETLRQHDSFLEILSARDEEKARAWMAAHIRKGRDEVLASMSPPT